MESGKRVMFILNQDDHTAEGFADLVEQIKNICENIEVRELPVSKVRESMAMIGHVSVGLSLGMLPRYVQEAYAEQARREEIEYKVGKQEYLSIDFETEVREHFSFGCRVEEMAERMRLAMESIPIVNPYEHLDYDFKVEEIYRPERHIPDWVTNPKYNKHNYRKNENLQNHRRSPFVRIRRGC